VKSRFVSCHSLLPAKERGPLLVAPHHRQSGGLVHHCARPRSFGSTILGGVGLGGVHPFRGHEAIAVTCLHGVLLLMA
jgi:hypothetical protein